MLQEANGYEVEFIIGGSFFSKAFVGSYGLREFVSEIERLGLQHRIYEGIYVYHSGLVNKKLIDVSALDTMKSCGI